MLITICGTSDRVGTPGCARASTSPSSLVKQPHCAETTCPTTTAWIASASSSRRACMSKRNVNAVSLWRRPAGCTSNINPSTCRTQSWLTPGCTMSSLRRSLTLRPAFLWSVASARNRGPASSPTRPSSRDQARFRIHNGAQACVLWRRVTGRGIYGCLFGI